MKAFGPNYLTKGLADQVQVSLQIASATEALWLSAPPASALRRGLKVPQLEALYESAFLRIFTTWEDFLEGIIVRYMAGYHSSAHQPSAVAGGKLFSTVGTAQATLYGTRRYLLWHDPARAADRCAKWLDQCPVEVALRTNQTALENYAAIRHRIAHSSDDAKTKFSDATLAISGTRTDGAAGKFLRAHNVTDPLNPRKWVHQIAHDLVDIGATMLP